MIKFALGFVFGAWLLQQQPALPSLYWLLTLIPALFFVLKSRTFSFDYADYLKNVSIFIFASLLGFLWAATVATIRLQDELPKEWQQKSINIVGSVAALPEITEKGERFQFDVEKVLTQESSKTLQIPCHISLNFYGDNGSATLKNEANKLNFFHAGERWQLTVKLKRPHTTYNPHGYDFEGWALENNIRATGSISNKSGYKKLSNFVWRPSYMVERVREKVGNQINQALANKPYAGVIRALVIGDDSQITQAQWSVYLRTGINHLMSISGLHITMLAGLAYAIAAFIWRRVPSLVLRMPTRKAATIVGLIVAVLYSLLAGMSLPTQRTLMMLITFALALLWGKNLAISRALAIALMVVVLLDPWASIAAGFWLSFSAVAIISYVSVGRLSAQHWFKEAVHTQWAITLGLLPLLIALFGQTSIVSPLANAFAIPIISLIVVPLAILGSIIHLDFILQAAHFILTLCMQGLNWLAALPTWQQAAPPMWATVSAVFGVLWLLLPRGFPQRWLGLVLLMPLFFANSPRPETGAMQVAVLDIGQGLSVVVKTANHTLLYDAGPKFNQQSDAGGRIVVPYLRGEGVTKLDGFMVSHNDIDHSGGAPSVLAQVPVGWFASSFTESDSFKLPTNALKCLAGQHWQWDSVQFAVLYPSLQSYEDANLSDNNRSCVVKITSQFGSILLTGDIEEPAEASLLAINADTLKSDVLIAPHHGSKTSSSPNFVQAVGAKKVIFTVGYLNRFKHPKPDIEKRYEASGVIEYRSDYAGALLIDFARDKPMQIQAWRQAQPRYWHDEY
ncbi:MAG: DNA internalization-related competence protein ComEC/Rec2 [Bdellovibrio sp.]|nr:DNA internalization-related competence protein ComEC/Rec2 [Methylotenera sp.]